MGHAWSEPGVLHGLQHATSAAAVSTSVTGTCVLLVVQGAQLLRGGPRPHATAPTPGVSKRRGFSVPGGATGLPPPHRRSPCPQLPVLSSAAGGSRLESLAARTRRPFEACPQDYLGFPFAVLTCCLAASVKRRTISFV